MTSKGSAHELRQNDELRIVLVGKTGVGKSAVGNTILGRDAFVSKVSPSSVTTECVKDREKVAEQCVAVIDTPGVFDTHYTEREAMTKISECISLSSPGPHVFLIVIQLGRFTPEEKETLKILQTTFGKQAEKYTMVLFTHGDQLGNTSINEYVKLCPDLQSFIGKFYGGCHVFNNRDQNPSQVTELLEKIKNMVKMNGGSHYTNEMFQEAERAIQEEEKRILKENEEKRCKEMEELNKKLKGEALENARKNLVVKYKREARNDAEKSNMFIKAAGGLVVAGAGAGGAIGARMGAAAGVVGGVPGVVVGAAAGGLVGGLAGGVARAGIITVSEKCSIQ